MLPTYIIFAVRHQRSIGKSPASLSLRLLREAYFDCSHKTCFAGAEALRLRRIMIDRIMIDVVGPDILESFACGVSALAQNMFSANISYLLYCTIEENCHYISSNT